MTESERIKERKYSMLVPLHHLLGTYFVKIKLKEGMSITQGNFFILPNHIFDYQLKPSAFLVYAYLVRCSNKTKGDTCFPSKKTIAKHCGISVSTVDAVIPLLIEENLISVSHRFQDKRQTSNLYFILECKKKEGDSLITVDSSPLKTNPPSLETGDKQDELNNTKYNKLSFNKEKELAEIIQNAETYCLANNELAELIESIIVQLYYLESLEVNGATIPQPYIRKQLRRIDHSVVWEFAKSIPNYAAHTSTPMHYLMVCFYNCIDRMVLELEQDFPTAC